MNLKSIILSAIAFISGLKTHLDNLKRENETLRAENTDLRQKLLDEDADDAEVLAAKEAAEARAAALQEAADALDASGTELAAAISENPDVPVTVDENFTAAQTDGVEPEASTAEAQAKSEAQRAE